MRDRVGFEAHGPNCCHRAGVVSDINGVGQEELRLPLASVNLDRENHGWSDQDTAFPGLGEDKSAPAISAFRRFFRAFLVDAMRDLPGWMTPALPDYLNLWHRH